MIRRPVSLKAVMGLVFMGIIAAAMACAPAATPTPTPTATRPAPTPTPTPTRAVVATPTPTPTRPTVAEPSGTVTFVTNLVGPVCGYRSSCPYGGTAIPPGTNDHYFAFDEATGNPMSPFLAESWEVAPDGRKVTIRFRKGVKWQTPIELRGEYPNGFGEFDAEDAVWWLNDANGALNPKSTNPDAGDYAAVFGQARVVDKYTMEADLISPIYFGLPLSEFGVLGAHAWHNSKKVYDALGPEKMGNYWVGTGPYVQGRWIGNERGEVEAVKDHWYYPNDRVQKFILVQVPEVSSRVAMLKAGEADLGVVDFKLVPNLIKEGLIWMPAMKNAFVGASIMFSGNLWEEFSARDGSPLEPWKSPVYEKDYPWIGLPAEWQDRVPYRDTDNPPGMSDMEQARLVRWALSMAIDRDSLVRILTGGLGTPIYSEYTGPEYPNWDPNQTVTKAELDQYVAEHGWTNDPSAKVQESVLKNEPWPWKVPYDPNRARELLRMAGYPNGFEITLNAYVCEIGEVCLEVADAITAAWQAIGLRVTQSREDYGAVISQRMRKREQIWPTLKNGDVHSNVWPKDWPFPPVDTSLSRPGWGPGFESVFLAEIHKKIRGLRDKAERERLHVQTVDWIIYWHFYSGVLQIPKGTVGNPAKVVSFEGRQDHYSNQPNNLNPAFIRLAK